MRLLLLGQDLPLEKINAYSSVYSHFVSRALRTAGADVVTCNPRNIDEYETLDLVDVDHIIGLRNKHFSKLRDTPIIKNLRKRFFGTISQINDSRISAPQIDCTFTARDPEGMPGNYYVGWAADPDVCRPAQRNGEMMILIDHPEYADHRMYRDLTSEIMKQVGRLIGSPEIWRGRFERISACVIRDGEIVESDLALGPDPFTRKHVPYTQAIAAYGRSSLFMVTHRESLGLGVLETAMCGALPIVPQGFIPADRLRTVRAIQYDGEIDWPTVLTHIDPTLSREVAMDNTWDKIAARMLKWLDVSTHHRSRMRRRTSV